MAAQKLWQASLVRQQQSLMKKFWDQQRQKMPWLSSYDDLYQWSINDLDGFWRCLAEFVGVIWEKAPEPEAPVYVPPPEPHQMLGAQWFPDTKLNFARNLLPRPDKHNICLLSYCEGRSAIDTWSSWKLWQEVAILAQAMKQSGVKPGDRIAAVMSNVAETIVIMLASASIGAVFSSCSPDFGVGGICDRFLQIKPKLLFYTISYQYNGKRFVLNDVMTQVRSQLKGVEEFIGVDVLGSCVTAPVGVSYAEFRRRCGYPENQYDRDLYPIEFFAAPFHHPLYILFSSGTTGLPKCIVHGTGATLLQHKKELMLHCDLQPSERILYYTTCGWMMWNWMVSALSCQAGLVLFEGSVSYPDLGILWRMVADHEVHILGTSPKYIAALMKQDFDPHGLNRELSQLKTILSTGSPLLEEHFDWVYGKFPDVHLASISGGTDIVSCFMLGNPLKPVFRGQIQGAGLGMAIEAWNESEQPVLNEKGELVCIRPFPSMPLGFWGDESGKRYQKAYFSFFKQEVWRHGDYILIDGQTGGIHVLGRSDATLNPGGVRMGTAEIYRHVEGLKEIEDSLVIAVAPPGELDDKVILFVKLASGYRLDESLREKIKEHIVANLTPRHKPHYIFQVSEIPYTRSGKKVELAVKRIFLGEQPVHSAAVMNPEVFAEYEQLARELLESFKK